MLILWVFQDNFPFPSVYVNFKKSPSAPVLAISLKIQFLSLPTCMWLMLASFSIWVTVANASQSSFFLLLILGSLKHWNGGFSTAAIIRINYFIQKITYFWALNQEILCACVCVWKNNGAGLGHLYYKNQIWFDRPAAVTVCCKVSTTDAWKKRHCAFCLSACGQPRFNGGI